MFLGMSQSFVHHSDSMCSLGLNSSSVCSGLPGKQTLVSKSLLNLVKEAVGFLFGLQGDGIHFKPRPIMVDRERRMLVSESVRSCISMFDGRVK